MRVSALALLPALGAGAAPDVATEPVSAAGCDGVRYDDVRGREPGTPHGSLRDVGSKPCQVAAVSLGSGRTRSFAARLDHGGPRP